MMNIFGLDEKKRILLLKTVLLGAGGAALFIGTKSAYELGSLQEKYKKAMKLAKLNNQVVQRFVELAPDEVCQKVYEEFAFDVVTLGFDDEEEKK
jgi:hypothetical protein